MSESKEFTDSECWQVVKALYIAQEEENPDRLDDLPREIRRALSLETMKTQVAKIIQSRKSSQERGAKGAAANASAAAHVDAIIAQQDAREAKEKDKLSRWLEWADKTPDDEILSFAKKGRIPAPVWDHLWKERADFVAYMRDKGVRVPPRPAGAEDSPAEKVLAAVAAIATT